jgi:hypothetical protein
MTFSKIKLFGFLALSCSLIACGQTPVSTAPNASPNAIAQTTTAPQPAETPAVVAKSPEPQPSAVASTEVKTAIAQSQDASAKTTVAQQTTKPIYSGMRQGIMYSIYIHEKQDLGGNRWRFRTRAEYSRGEDYYSPWRTADCGESSIDGKIIPAIARSGAEEGGARLIQAICGLSAVSPIPVETAIAQPQDSATNTTVAQQATEPIGSGMRQGIMYKVYIHENQDLGGNRWRFRTRAEYSRGKDYYSPWRTADCGESSIDGEIIPAIARSGAEEGGARLIQSICGLSK